MSRNILFVLLMATGIALADEAPKTKDAGSATEAQKKTKEDPSLGMSILGNQEAPKALVIIPWKRSEIGNALGISTMLDDSRLPIDKEVFMRVLSYYEVRSTTTRHDGAAAGKSEAAQPATTTRRRKS